MRARPADGFGLLALRQRKAVAWSIVCAGILGLFTTYVVPLAAELRAPALVTPLEQLSVPDLAFPLLKIPPKRHAAAPRQAATVGGGPRSAPAGAPRGTARAVPRGTTAVPVQSNSFVRNSAPARPKPQTNLPTYDNSYGGPEPTLTAPNTGTYAQSQAVTASPDAAALAQQQAAAQATSRSRRSR